MSGALYQFNWVDVLALLLVVRLGYMGVRLGLGVELTKIAGVLAGLFASFQFYQAVGDWIATRTPLTHEWAGATALILLVIVVYLLAGILLRVVQTAATIRFAPSLDKGGGVVVAVARAGLVMSIVLVALQQLPSDTLRTSIEERSWSGRYLVRMAPAVYDSVTPWIQRGLPAVAGDLSPVTGRSGR